MKTKQRLINSFTLEYHPLVARLLREEITVQSPPCVIDHLHEHEIHILLKTITLHVIPVTQEHYLLLTPAPLFVLLRQHPSVQSQKVSICEYQQSADNIEQIITTLMLTLPALQYNYHSSTLKTLACRLNIAKSNTVLPTNLIPKKSQLALFSGVSPSAIRSDTKKLAINDDNGKA
ncbi:hypothetical protein K8B83_17590 [Shewanella inventionis]|uniref:hypothetical protein n=1 Tax=Shewanella inventionis TaxID=1738770 RepID=UPI001CC19403|nr:hypothetical protein [Shewanella inventionis]UAL42623.1 hypothetical protein K8B83_17590 [Shewanella inventionis]